MPRARVRASGRAWLGDVRSVGAVGARQWALGDGRYQAEQFDFAYPEQWEIADDKAIALIDGAFLLRPERGANWDYLIWVENDFETMIARARKRGSDWVGSEDVVAERDRHHWVPTHELSERLESPRERADVTADNREIWSPRLIFPEHRSSDEFA